MNNEGNGNVDEDGAACTSAAYLARVVGVLKGAWRGQDGGTGQIRASNEPPRRGLKIDISVFAPSSPRAVRRGAVRPWLGGSPALAG